ncbi:2-succinyl-5-enolpyruvyl-6-hydroxy-3-cyclohexene-1-carboxylic-acid synthase [Terrilactibacillus laevilacticus]|uniref:2-succinyl-5-enolpyruvyl-6-hydroxy-3-cyclohexene-1-carboxylate synthase n=1 Tax=Terrilactibacillus laevilacticus TaxID=1380157 RepID=A0ABW5PQR0_9BACI|nr:2-succinyl-5-enolpyruvyl-6-hydroxy-3-cyclohexene-1-carboxylic-acid synthase [Terrilactibacillus laevilacticus]
MTRHQEKLTRFCAAFIDELALSGLKHIVISPGSRSTPLTMLFDNCPDIKVWMNVDERSAGFFALGIAKACMEPVAILCTSGTAAANYYPAIVEAKLAGVPLVVLTADRPHHLRDVGAPQAIDQIKLYGDQVKWFKEMPPQSDEKHTLQFVRKMARRAYSVSAASPKGPVHLNFPFEEPLIPSPDMDNLWTKGHSGSFYYENELGSIPEHQLFPLLHDIQSINKGLIVVGPVTNEEAIPYINAFAKQCGFPIIADPLSGMRSGDHDKTQIIDMYDAIFREPSIPDLLASDGVIRFGAMPVSKSFSTYLTKVEPKTYLIVDEKGSWRDPTHLSTQMIGMSPISFCQLLTSTLQMTKNDRWLSQWININRDIQKRVKDYSEEELWFEGQAFVEVLNEAKPEATLFVGNSMPVRDLDTFFISQEKKIHPMANRGANGIDGVISTALGAAAVRPSVILVIGDLSFYHDMNGLLMSKCYDIDITIVVVNNNGGGIFSFLPQAKESDRFEALFATSTDLEIEYAARMYKGKYSNPTTWQAFRKELQLANDEPGLKVIEIQTNRQENTSIHRKLWDDIQDIVKARLIP